MADENEDIEVIVDPVVEPEVEVILAEGADAPIAEPPPKAVEPAEGIEALQANLERERSGRLAAEAREREAIHEARTARTDVQETNLVLFTNAIDTIKQSNEILKGNYRDAMTNGDFDAASEAQMSMATNAAKMQRLEEGKTELEARAKEPVQERRSSDPVEAFAAQLSPKSADWVRAHPEYVTDPRLNQKMLAAHNLAMSDNIKADSPEYFEAIEDVLKIRRAPVVVEDDATSGAAQAVERRASPAAAPVSRTPSHTNGTKPNTVRLSAAEREIAAMNHQTDAEYAREKLALQREGKLN